MINCLVVGLGGFAGAVLRYLVSLIPTDSKNIFPYLTLIINVVGAFVLGLIVAVVAKNTNFDPRLSLFLRVGLCGGFTTFSTFALESHDLFTNGHIGLGLVYVFVSVILSIAAVFGASYLVK